MSFWVPRSLRPKPAEDPNAIRYADIYERAVAAAIDLWILFLLLNGVFRWMAAGIYRHADPGLMHQANEAQRFTDMIALMWDAHLFHLWLLNALVQLGVIGFCIINAQMIWGATPGKYLMGLRIARRHTLEQPSTWRLILRFVAYLPAAAPMMLGIIWASFNKERRGWHDMIAGTVVVHTRPRGWLWHQLKALPARLRRKFAGK